MAGPSAATLLLQQLPRHKDSIGVRHSDWHRWRRWADGWRCGTFQGAARARTGFFLTHSSCKVIEWTQTDGTDWDHLEVFFPCPTPPPQSQMAANESAPFCQPAHDQLTGTQNPAEVHHLSRSHDIPGRPAFILGHESRNPGEGMGRTAKALAASAAANGKRVVIGVPCNTWTVVQPDGAQPAATTSWNSGERVGGQVGAQLAWLRG